MAINLYDKALAEKIQKWIPENSPLTLLSPNDSTNLFKIEADRNNDKPLELPLIAVSRDSNIKILNTSKRYMTFNGIKVATAEQKTMQLNAIPIQLDYQIDIYTRYIEEADEYLREFIFKLINEPKLTIVLPYNNIQYEHDSNIRLYDSVQDNSDIAEHLFHDQFVRYTIKINIDDAYLWSVPAKTNYLIEDTELETKQNN